MTERAPELPADAIATLQRSLDPGSVIVVEDGVGRLTQSLLDGRHALVADEPAAAGGLDAGPGPYELLLMALGSCTSMTLRLYADRKQWPLERVRVRLHHAKVHADDCADCDERPAMIDRIDRSIELTGELDAEQRRRLLQIADQCPVHRTLSSKIEIHTVLG